MKFFIKAKPGAKAENIIKKSETNFVISVKEPPARGKANRAIIRALARYLGLSPSKLTIVSGSSSKQKVIEIDV